MYKITRVDHQHNDTRVQMREMQEDAIGIAEATLSALCRRYGQDPGKCTERLSDGTTTYHGVSPCKNFEVKVEKT